VQWGRLSSSAQNRRKVCDVPPICDRGSIDADWAHGACRKACPKLMELTGRGAMRAYVGRAGMTELCIWTTRFAFETSWWEAPQSAIAHIAERAKGTRNETQLCTARTSLEPIRGRGHSRRPSLDSAAQRPVWGTHLLARPPWA